MPSVQELLQVLNANKSPMQSLLEGFATGYGNAQSKRLENAKILMEMEQQRQDRERLQQQDQLIRQQMGIETENKTQQDLKTVGAPATSPLPAQRMKMKATVDDKTGLFKPTFEMVEPKDVKFGAKEYQDAQGVNRIGKLNESTGELIQSQNDPLAPKQPTSPEDKEQAKLDSLRKKNQPIEKRNLNNAISNFDRMIAEAKAIRDHGSLSVATGMTAPLSAIPGTEARNVRARINTLKSKTGFSVLQEMRASSPTGGALGQVSDRENQLLQENIASLDTGQNTEDFKAALNRVIDYAEGAKKRLQTAYDETYGGYAPADVSVKAPPQPKTLKVGRFEVTVEQ